MEAKKREILSGELVVLFLDECHLLWSDLCGYVWGKTNQRIAVEVVNERQKQTYFGALNYCTQEFLVQAYEKGNSDSTITFIEYLLAQYPQCRIAIFWDGASYHRSRQFRDYLDALNQGREPPEWKITRRALCTQRPRTKPS